MLALWIASFLAGVVFGRVVPCAFAIEFVRWSSLLGLAALGLFAIFLCHGSRRSLVARGVVICLGVLWGLAHSAPFPTASLTDMVIVKTAVRDSVSGPMIVGNRGQYYEVLGPQRLGAAGDVKALPTVRIFGTTRGTFRTPSRAEPAGELFGETRDAIRSIFARRMESLTPFYRRWLAGLVLGESAVLPRDVRDAFKRTGLYHLLVVSGLHVSLMAIVLAAMLRAPAQAAYALRLIAPHRWRQVAAALDVLAGAAALLYLAVTGSPAAAQRAALLFAVWQASAIFFGQLSTGERLCLAAALQILVFPVGFVGEGTLMSWAAYILVLAPLSRERMEFTWRVPESLSVQASLMVLVTAVFGQLAFVGLAANLVLIPAFPVLLGTALVAMGFPDLPTLPLMLAIQRSFIGLVRLFDGLCDRWPWLSIAPEALPEGVRLVAVVLSVWILLNRCRDLSISR